MKHSLNSRLNDVLDRYKMSCSNKSDDLSTNKQVLISSSSQNKHVFRNGRISKHVPRAFRFDLQGLGLNHPILSGHTPQTPPTDSGQPQANREEFLLHPHAQFHWRRLDHEQW